MAKQEQREIALNFITNAEETKSKVDALLNSLDKTDDSYAELEQQSASLESAITDVNNAMSNSTGSSNILQNSIKKLEGETTKATTSLSKTSNTLKQNTNATNTQKRSTEDLTKSIVSNGGAISVLDSLTGGLASQVKNISEATGVFTTATDGSSKSLGGWKMALASTGIGLLIVGVTALINLMITLRQRTDEQVAAQLRLNEAQRQANFQNTLSIKGYEDEIRLKRDILNGLSEEEAAQRRVNNLANERNLIREQHIAYDREINDLIKEIGITKDNNLTLSEKENLIEKRLGDSRYAHYQELVKQRDAYKDKADVLTRSIDIQELDLKIEQKRAKETVKANEGRLKSTVKTNKKIVESEEDKIKRLEALQNRYNKIVGDRALNNLPNPTIGFELISKERVETLKKEQKEVQEILEEQYKDSKKAVYAFEKWFNDTYYDTQIKREEALLQRQKVSLETFRMYIDGIEEGLDLDGGVFNTFQDYREEVIKFSDSIENSKIKEKFDSIFNVDQLKESSAVLQRFKEDIINLDTQLTSLDGTGEGVVMTGLFGKNYKENLKNAVKEVQEANLKIIDEQERQALLLAVTEAEKQAIRDHYNKLRVDNEKAANEEVKKNLEETEQQKLAIVSASAQASMDLIDAGLEFASEGDRERIKSNAAYKTAMIGLTTIDTFASAMSAYKGMTAAIPGPWGIAAGVAAAASSVAMGLNNVKKIASVKLEGSSGGGGGSISAAGATPNVSFVSSSENQIANSVNANTNAQNQEPIKAYVVSGDVSSGQALERNKIESNSI